MTAQVTDIAQSTHAGVAPDARALHVAKALRDATDVECVILFGSRARGDWTDRSDIDLMIIEPDTSELIPRMGEIQQTATELATWLIRIALASTSFTCPAPNTSARASTP